LEWPRGSVIKIANNKSQITNKHQLPKFKIRNPSTKPVLVIEYWNLSIVCNLMLGIWDFNKMKDSKDNSSLLKSSDKQTRSNEGTYHGQTNG
jgi:hypothetical protein